MTSNYDSSKPFRTLLYLYREDWGNLGISMGFYIIKHSPEWLRPIIYANVINIISHPNSNSQQNLLLNGLILGACVLQNILTHYLHIRFMSKSLRRVEANLRLAIVQRLQELSFSFYENYGMGALQNKLIQDVENIQQLTYNLFQYLPATFLTIIVAISVVAVRAPIFLLFFAVTIPLAVILIRIFHSPVNQRNAILRQKLEGLAAYLIEMLKLLPITRSHGIEAVEIQRTKNKIETLQKAEIKVDTINAFANASAWVTLQLFSCLCLITSATLVYRDQWGITVGDVIILTTYFDVLTGSVMQILAVLPQLGKGFEAVRSIGEILRKIKERLLLKRSKGTLVLHQ